MSTTRGAGVHAAAMSKVTKNVNSILKNIEKLDRQANEAQTYIDEVVGRVLQGTNEAPGPMADAHELAKAREEVQSRMATYQRLQEEKVQLSRSLYESISTQGAISSHMSSSYAVTVQVLLAFPMNATTKAVLIYGQMRYEACLCRNSRPACHRFQNVVQVAELEKSKTAIEHDMASVAARIAHAQTANHARLSSKSSSVAGPGGRGGRKSGRAAAAATTFAPEVVPLPIATAPVIPAHFVPYTFHYPGREPFMEYVDPNEPKYCICNQPSQGDMIGCDNPACTREWFHNICVGIQTPPEKWFCPECREACEGLPAKEASEGPPPKRSTRRS